MFLSLGTHPDPFAWSKTLPGTWREPRRNWSYVSVAGGTPLLGYRLGVWARLVNRRSRGGVPGTIGLRIYSLLETQLTDVLCRDGESRETRVRSPTASNGVRKRKHEKHEDEEEHEDEDAADPPECETPGVLGVRTFLHRGLYHSVRGSVEEQYGSPHVVFAPNAGLAAYPSWMDTLVYPPQPASTRLTLMNVPACGVRSQRGAGSILLVDGHSGNPPQPASPS
jgi:hypothetical protein